MLVGYIAIVWFNWIVWVDISLLQVTIGSSDLKANHAIDQVVEVVSEHEKYPKYVHIQPSPFCTTHWDQIQVYI